MTRMFLILFLVWGLCAMPGVTTGQQIYKWVDEKGTVHFSETPTSDSLKPQEKQNSKERTLEIVTGVETREPSREELLMDYQNKRGKEQEGFEATKQAEQERRLKAIKDQQDEMQWRRDREADRLEKEARKTIYDPATGKPLSGMTKGQQQMLRDAARLRSGFDLEPSPPPSEEAEKWKRRARQAESEARRAESEARDAERKTRDAEWERRR